MSYPEYVNWQNRYYVKEGKWRRLKIEVFCPDCKKSRFVDRRNIDRQIRDKKFTGRCLACSKKFMRHKNASNWKGGIHLASGGKHHGLYLHITVTPEHPFYSMANSRNTIAIHRLIMAQKLGRALKTKELVHHIDGNRLNNAIGNLMIMTQSEHAKLHLPNCKKKEVYHSLSSGTLM